MIQVRKIGNCTNEFAAGYVGSEHKSEANYSRAEAEE